MECPVALRGMYRPLHVRRVGSRNAACSSKIEICRPGEVECVPSGTTRSVRWTRATTYAGRTLTLQMLTNGFNRPVLKHGPRSLTYARVLGCQTTEA